MEVYRTIVYSYAFIVLTNSAEVGNPTWTVCAGNQTSFFCETIDPLNVLLVIFVKENQTIGLYTPGGVTAVYPEFKDRYRIIEEQSGISLKIIKTKTLDQGRFFCQITYDVKPNVKLEKFLIVKERKSSSLIKFFKKTVNFCTSVTCSANSNLVKLKTPDNTVITEKHILLDSCQGSLTNGEYSCCLSDICSQGECQNLTLEVTGEHLVTHWIVLAIIGTLILMAIIVAAVLYKLRMRRKNNQNQTNLLLEEQQKPLIPTLLSNVEKLASTMETDGKMNFYRMVYLTFEIVPRAVKYKFDQLIPFGDLKQKLMEKQEALQKLKNKGVLTPDQWKILYPKKGIVKSTDFDTTLMLLLLRTIGVISRPVNGWYTFPNKTDCSASADLIRILLLRNRLAYCTGGYISKRDFNGIWEKLTKAIIRIGGSNSTDEIKAISKIPLDQLIEKHYKEFEELKSKDTIQKNTLDLIEHKLLVWEEDDKAFVVTRLTNAVITAVTTNDIIMVTGPPGSGKSATLHHIALKLKRSGYRVCPVDSLDEILQYWMPAVSQVFIYDDPFGIQGIDEAEVNVWRKKQDTLKIFFQNSCIKILISIRSVINKNIKIEKLIDHESISHKTICLTDENIKLNQNEKLEIFKKHHKYQDQSNFDNIVTEIQNLEDTYFPLLCKIFGFESDFKYATVSFFKDPLSVFENVVADFQSNDGLQYFCLLLCMINDNEISLESLDCTKEEATFQSLMDDLLNMCKLERSIPKSEITKTLQRLENTFLVKDGCNYHFAHSFIHDAVLKHIVKSSEEVHGKIIKHCSAKFLRTRVYLENMNTNKETCIVIVKSLESCWGQRIIHFIEDGTWHDVFHNACLSTERGDKILNAELKNISPSEIQMIMCNSKRNEIKVNLNVLDGSYNIDEQLEDIKSNALHFAVLKGLVNVVTTTLKSISFVAKQNTNDHINLFLLACASGKEVLMKTLRPNTPTKSNSVSPLFISCFHGHENIVKYLLTYNKAEVDNCTNEGKSPLNVSAEGGHDIVVKLLIENKAEVNKCTYEGMSPLYVSALGGHEKVVQLLMDNGAEVNKCTSEDKSPLYISSARGHDNIVKMLLNKGAEVNKCTSEDKSPLYVSAARGHVNIVKMLINKGAEVNKCTSEDKSPLYISAAGGHDNVVRMLINKGAEVNKCAVEGKSPLYVSAAGGHDMVVKQLIDNTGEVNQCTHEHKSPLYISAAGGYKKVVKQLIDHNADVNKCSIDDKSPLYASAKAGHVEIVKRLLEKKAEVNKCTSEGKSPLYISAARGYDEVVKLLIDNNAQVNGFTNYGETPLFVSSCHGHEKVVKLLIEKGADVNISTKYGHTPLNVTSNYKIKEMLINKDVQTKKSNA